VEYFLYAAIIVETALAATVYKTIFHISGLLRLGVYFGIFYFAFLAWAIAQVKVIRRNRDPEPIERKDVRLLLGLTGSQLAILVVVFATAVATFSWALRLLH
jgi:hypothetical protein